MIDRTSFRIAGFLVAAMLAAAAWRVSLLPDWTELYVRPGAPRWLTSSAWLLSSPAIVAFMMAWLAWPMRRSEAPDEVTRPWNEWAGFYLVVYGAIMALLQAFVIANSLHLLTPANPAHFAVLFVRGMFIVAGLLLMAMSNGLPKLPWLPSRYALVAIDPDRGARLLRLRGQLGFLFGLIAVLIGLFVPLAAMQPVILSLVLAGAAVGMFVRFAPRREI